MLLPKRCSHRGGCAVASTQHIVRWGHCSFKCQKSPMPGSACNVNQSIEITWPSYTTHTGATLFSQENANSANGFCWMSFVVWMGFVFVNDFLFTLLRTRYFLVLPYIHIGLLFISTLMPKHLTCFSQQFFLNYILNYTWLRARSHWPPRSKCSGTFSNSIKVRIRLTLCFFSMILPCVTVHKDLLGNPVFPCIRWKKIVQAWLYF